MKNGQRHGPVAVEQLRALITSSDLVWKEGFAQWVPAASVPNLFPASASPPLPPPPPPVSAHETGKIMPSSSAKDPILMAVLSFFIPWLGQLVLGQTAKGIVMFLLTPILFAIFVIATLGMGLIVLPFVDLIAAVDAYLLAKKLKEGRAIGNWEFFGIESAPTLTMPTLPPKVIAKDGKPAVPVKPRPPGLVGSAVGMLFVSGLAMMISLLGVIGIVANQHMPVLMQILIALSFIHNAWVIFAVIQSLRLQRYAFAITAPLLVVGSWVWLAFSGIPIGMTVMGILGGISVGVWSLGVLRQPEVRAAFANQYDPLETLLPMARATIEGQTPNLTAFKGLLKQMLGNKIALGIAGGVLLILLLVPMISLFTPSTSKSKFLGAAPSVDGPGSDGWGEKKARKKSRIDGSDFMTTDDDDDVVVTQKKKKSPKTIPSGSSAYQKGYRLGHDAAKAAVDLARLSGKPFTKEERDDLMSQAEEFQRTCARLQGVTKGSQEERDMVRGYYDGLKAALGE
jgi:TM2 domain-containing membrane protein YozV